MHVLQNACLLHYSWKAIQKSLPIYTLLTYKTQLFLTLSYRKDTGAFLVDIMPLSGTEKVRARKEFKTSKGGMRVELNSEFLVQWFICWTSMPPQYFIKIYKVLVVSHDTVKYHSLKSIVFNTTTKVILSSS